MDSLFITGTDTGIGKTYVAAGIATTLRVSGTDVGVMKPFAAGDAQKSGFKSDDAQILRRAAQIKDPESLVNPQFFSIEASPYTAQKKLGINPDIQMVIKCFKRLSEIHDMLVVEGIGGVMTPITENYFVADMIVQMNIPAIIVAGSRIGTINHTIMTCLACKERGVKIKGIIINDFDRGYDVSELAKDLECLTGVNVLGSIPFMNTDNHHHHHKNNIYEIFNDALDIKHILEN